MWKEGAKRGGQKRVLKERPWKRKEMKISKRNSREKEKGMYKRGGGVTATTSGVLHGEILQFVC